MGVAISAQGSKFFIDTAADGAAQPTWLKVNGVKSFSGFDGTPSDIDTTDLDSEAKESQPGLIDNGAWSIDVNRNLVDPGQAAIKAAQVANAVKQFKLRYPDGTSDTFSAYCRSFPIAGGVDAVMTATVTFKITGAVTPVEAGV